MAAITKDEIFQALPDTDKWVTTVNFLIDIDRFRAYEGNLYALIRDDDGIYRWEKDKYKVDRYFMSLTWDGYTITALKNIKEQVFLKCKVMSSDEVNHNLFLTNDGYYIEYINGQLLVTKQDTRNNTKFCINHFNANYELTQDCKEDMMFKDFITKFCSGSREDMLYVAQLCAAMHFKLRDNITWLYGPSAGNGKSTLSGLNMSMSDACAAFDPHALTHSNFALEQAASKTLLVIDELKDTSARTVEKLKQLSGGTTIVIDRKNKDAIEDKISKNILVTSQFKPSLSAAVNDDGFLRRLFIFVCKHKFEGDSTVRVKLMTSPHVRSQLLRFVLTGLQLYINNGYTIKVPFEHEYEKHTLVNGELEDRSAVSALIDIEPELNSVLDFETLASEYYKRSSAYVGGGDQVREFKKLVKQYWVIESKTMRVDGDVTRASVLLGFTEAYRVARDLILAER